MKEAAGEANLTVIAIILIGVIATVVTPMINSYMNNTAKQGCCTGYGGIYNKGKCYETTVTGAQGADITGSVWDSANRTCKNQ